MASQYESMDRYGSARVRHGDSCAARLAADPSRLVIDSFRRVMTRPDS